MTLVLPSKTLYSLEDFDDDYEFGIDKTNMSIQFVETSTGTLLLKDDEIENPFFVSVNGGSLLKIEPREIYSGYKRVLFMCMRDDFVLSSDLFQITDQIVKSSSFYPIGNQFVLVPASLSALRNNIYKNRACIVDKKHLMKMFNQQHQQNFDLNEIIIPLIEQTESNTKTIVALYDKQYGVENLKNILDITAHYNKSYKRPIADQFSNILSSLKESQFWCDSANCDINMTETFMARGFNYKDHVEDGTKTIITGSLDKFDKEIEKVINTLSDGTKKKDTDYLNHIHTSNEFTDVATALKNSAHRTYYIELDDKKLNVKEQDLEELICSIDDESELYHTFNNLIQSKDYCHMVLNNMNILTKVKPLFDKYGPVYKLLLGYAWQCFTIEESIMKTKSTKTNRYVFDINTANKLPVFPFAIEDLTQNPYITMLVNQKVLNPATNAVSLHCLENFDQHYGVCNLDQFKWRFNLFTTGDPTKNIFEGINWEHFAVSGSIIPACLQKKSPLFNIVTLPGQKEEDKWLTFFSHYYGESDIDIMCNDQSIYGFTTKAGQVIEQIKKNIPDYKEGDAEIEPIKSMLLMVSKHFYTERLAHFNEYFNYSFTVEQMMNKIGTEEMREYLYGFYYEHKTKFNSLIRKEKRNTNEYIRDFMTITPVNEMKMKEITRNITKQQDTVLDSDMCFYINDFRGQHDKVLESENFLVMKIGENIKFKVKSKKIKTIELFRSKTTDFFGVVAKFHLPCVRAYYQGDNVYILPTCVSAMMTGINVEYKYFAGVRDPIEIINKYRMRGYGILLSDQEKKHMAYYNNKVKESFGGMFHVAGTNKEDINRMFGPRELSDKIYRPLVYTQKYPEDTYGNPTLSYIKTVADLKRFYKTKYGYDENIFGFNLFVIKTINEGGSINPLKPWVSKEYYLTANQNKVSGLSSTAVVPPSETNSKQQTQQTQQAQQVQLAKPTPVAMKVEVKDESDDEKPVKKSKKSSPDNKMYKISDIGKKVAKTYLVEEDVVELHKKSTKKSGKKDVMKEYPVEEPEEDEIEVPKKEEKKYDYGYVVPILKGSGGRSFSVAPTLKGSGGRL